MSAAPRLILGSASPRRRDLLGQIGVVPDAVRPPEIDETPRPKERPRDYVRRIARAKADAVEAAETDVVLCADTTVVLGSRLLGKPANEAEARSFLDALSGRRHRVITAVAVGRGGTLRDRVVETRVALKRLSDLELRAYLATGDWRGKAGAYAIQGPAGAFVTWINGSFTAVVGLPLAETASLLTGAGYPVWGAA